MNKKKFTKLLALYLPYLVIGLAATNLGEAWRLAEGKELGDKIMSLMNLFSLSQKSVITVWAIQSVWTVRILRSKLSEL